MNRDKHYFEDQLNRMSKPQVRELAHQDALAKVIVSAKNKAVVSGWWLAVPVYMSAALLVKSCYTHKSLSAGMHELMLQNKTEALFFFVVVPLVFMVLNLGSMRRIYRFSGGLNGAAFVRLAWFNLLVVVCCWAILILYL